MLKQTNWFFRMGITLIALSISLLLFFHLRAKHSEGNAQAMVTQIEAYLPQRTAGIPDLYTNMEMSVLSTEDGDFAGIVEIPAYGRSLPLGAQWETARLSSWPCRFSGTVYDSSLVIGGSSQPGQFDFFGQLQPGAAIIVTDMTGAQFRYTVSRIDHSQSADASRLIHPDYHLTLFARDVATTDYLIVRCLLG